jgi:glycosyltransferase involved in cell wall biosynthesis
VRVAHLVSHAGTYGGERFVAALARGQRAAGIDAAILTIYDSSGVPGVPIYSAGRREAYAPGGGFVFFFRLVRLLQQLRPDVAHTHLAHAKYWGRLAAVAAGVPHLVHTEHGNDFTASPVRRVLTRLLHAKTDRIVALTRAQERGIVRHEGAQAQRIAVIPNGIEPRSAFDRSHVRRVLGISEGACAVFFIGRLDAVKAPLRAVDALALLPAESNAHVYFLGDGRLRTAILERARERGIVERTHLLGYRADAAALLPGADALVNVSESEAMPLSLIEALCTGVPVVSTPWPGVDELVGNAGCIANSFDAGAVARELEKALRRRPIAPEAIAASRDRFSITRAVSDYSALYEALLERGPMQSASPIPNVPELSGLPQ